MERSDQEWVRSLKQDDPQAVADLWEMVYRFGIAAVRRYSMQEDIGANGAIAAFERIRKRGVSQYKYKCPFKWFCRRIVINEVNRLLRREGRTVIIEKPIEDIHHPSLGQEPTPLLVSEKTVQERLNECLKQLTKLKRDVVEFRYFQKLKPGEIAEKLELTRSHVNKLAFDARKSLKLCLEGKGFYTVADVMS